LGAAIALPAIEAQPVSGQISHETRQGASWRSTAHLGEEREKSVHQKSSAKREVRVQMAGKKEVGIGFRDDRDEGV
jgi:hypothetical protein